MRKNKSTLTDKQEKFCLEYIVDFNATQAAIRAGYSTKTAYSVGSENLRKPEVQKRVKELTNEIKSKKIADANEIRETLTLFLRDEATEDVLVTEGDGEGYSKVRHERKGVAIRDRLKSAELLAKLLGLLDKKDDGENKGTNYNGEGLIAALNNRKIKGVDDEEE